MTYVRRRERFLDELMRKTTSDESSRQDQEWPEWMPRLAFSPEQTAPRGDTMIVIFLRGAADALNIVVPFGEDTYYQHRPSLSIPRPDDLRAPSIERAIELNEFFGLHPALAGLKQIWDAKHLAAIHACGAPDDSRSHFRAMELMERGVTDMTGPASGWINRHLSSFNTGNPSPLRAIGLGETTPRSLSGSIPISALQSIADFHLGDDQETARFLHSSLGALYSGSSSLDRVGRETLRIIETLQKLDPKTYLPQGGAVYPGSPFGVSLQQIAMLIKADVGLEVAAVDLGGWDTHFAQGASTGLMANLLTDLADGLHSFYLDLQQWVDRLTIVVMTEFGRRVQENASLGTDHGHGGLMLLLGGNVVGGRVHGEWPGLEVERLFGPGDLTITTDYRDVLSEVCAVRLNNPAVGEIFPGYQPVHGGYVKRK